MDSAQRPSSRIPAFASREEEAEFWDTHDITEYLDEFQVVDRRDVIVDENLSTGITVRLTPDMLRRLRRTAKERGIGPSTLARIWIVERLRENTDDAPASRRHAP